MANRYWLVSSCTLTTASELTGGENGLTWNPHPTEFVPYSDARVQGTGDAAGLGYAQFKWTSGDGWLTARQWAHLMGFFSGSEPSVSICVRTRTDRWSVNSLGEYQFQYRWFEAIMHRPIAEFGPDFRLRNVEIVFTHATEVT
jgi:hypothetical protein